MCRHSSIAVTIAFVLVANIARCQEPEEASDVTLAPSITQELEKRFKNPAILPKVEVVESKRKELPSKLLTTEQGTAYQYASSAVEPFRLGDKQVLDMCPSPNGKFLFVIIQNESTIQVLSTEDFQQVAEVVCPRYPVSLWCDSSRLAVACDESKVVTFFDVDSLEATFAATVKNSNDLAPSRIVGRAPDGSLITLWRRSDTFYQDAERHVYLIGENLNASYHGYAPMDSCCFLRDGAVLTFQGELFRPSYGPVFVRSEVIGNLRKEARLFPSTKTDHGTIFLARDSELCLLPRYVSIPDRAFDGDQTETFVLSQRLDSQYGRLTGLAIQESNGMLLTVETPRIRPGQSAPDFSIHFYDAVTMELLRIVSFGKTDDIRSLPRSHLDFRYVPGHEMLFFKAKVRDSKQWWYVRCGPLLKSAVTGESNAAARLRTTLPSRIKVGTRFEVKLDMENLPSSSRATFVLVEGPPGMKVSTDSGLLVFVPNAVNVGECRAEISCKVDGQQVQLKQWVFEVIEE
ncbi:hypothetical protein SH449x_001771 [Pirellulaceae bacterium SH449]